MSLSTGGVDLMYANTSALTNKTSPKADALEAKLKNGGLDGAADEELLSACKEFETYLLEQVMKQMKKTVKFSEDEEENDYAASFGDMLYGEYAKNITESGELGIAQILYESMKRNA